MKKIERISDLERKYVSEVLDQQFKTSSGSIMNTRLENAIAELYGVKYVITFVNGTTTMHAALLAAGIKEGDEVIVPPLTMASTTFAVLQAGATPIYADVDPDTFQIDPVSIEKNITNKTKAIITVALYGLSPDMVKIMELAQKHNLFVLEDNAETMLSKQNGKFAGTFGHAASFSFQSSKHLTAGEGGVIITDDEELALNIRRISSLGYAGVSSNKGKITKRDIQEPDYFRHVSDGYNYRMPELCAAVALGQVERVDELVQRRIDVAKLFESIVEKADWINSQYVPENYVNSYWTYVAKLDTSVVTWLDFRDKFMSLGGDGVYAPWKLTYQEPFYNNLKTSSSDYRPQCEVAEDLQQRLLQFKTNYWDWDQATVQAEILDKTIKYFDK